MGWWRQTQGRGHQAAAPHAPITPQTHGASGWSPNQGRTPFAAKLEMLPHGVCGGQEHRRTWQLAGWKASPLPPLQGSAAPAGEPCLLWLHAPYGWTPADVYGRAPCPPHCCPAERWRLG